ncbi:MAG: hypothetical protein N5P05_001064 [Chroococcopsis gigantea SAG 12.99]|jgi:hypothetical protein|nr:CRR6 family NdhI maturation factor [Chlorogloea purpurea SAG 13.99]MDV2999458.1 hypothetical protein [Chroococcopsis gigantea SAG 12.99]
MTTTIVLTPDHINSLDLSPANNVIDDSLKITLSGEQPVQFTIQWPRTEDDIRELSEIPEIRLWFVRLDAAYPWFPLLLDPKSGELARYCAMLVPHQFHRTEGIQYNPEALEIFVMHKIFIFSDWLKSQRSGSLSRLQAFAQLFGYDLDQQFLESL